MKTDVFVARQPILDQRQEVTAYELLYRAGGEIAVNELDPTVATSSVIVHALHTIGLGRLVGRHKAFIKFERGMLVKGVATLLPPRKVVIEVLRGTAEDEEVVAACTDLKNKGYELALDGFTGELHCPRLVELASILRVDFQSTTPAIAERLAERYGRRGMRMLAKKVETPEQFTSARDMGYELFQGYFFAKPRIVAGSEIPEFKLNHLRVLEAVNQPLIEFDRLSEVMRFEPAMVHKLLSYVNSASHGLRREIESIQHALALLGEREVRKWVSLVVVAGLAAGKPRQLVVNSVVRGRFCEQL
ncbi:MAG: HDOD domain-containing protein, partial [bacterium]|nr:HDOD domain-containing protein [bacterium]